MTTKLQVRNDTAANWTSANPTLLAGEIGFETDTLKFKIGNGSTVWTSLSYSPATVTPSAGTASTAPIKLTSGTNLTTASAGAIEYDGYVFYNDVAESTRGVVVSEQITVLNSAFTLSSQTAAQRLFNSSANGIVNLPIGTYQFECFYSLSGMSSTSGSFGFALVNNSGTYSQQWMSVAQKGAAATTTATATQSVYTTSTAATSLTANSTNTVGYAFIKGTINVTATASIIPSVSFTTVAGAVTPIVGTGSYFKISPVSGLNSTNSPAVGNWT